VESASGVKNGYFLIDKISKIFFPKRKTQAIKTLAQSLLVFLL